MIIEIILSLILIACLVPFWKAGARAGFNVELKSAARQARALGVTYSDQMVERNIGIYKKKNQYVWFLTLLLAKKFEASVLSNKGSS
jgi:hypothetical protein